MSPPQSSAPARYRALWRVLAVVFAAFLLLRLYKFAQGKEEIYESLLPAAFLLLSTAQLVAAKEGLIYKLLLLASIILMFAGAVSLALVEMRDAGLGF